MDAQDFVTRIRRLHPMQSVEICFATSGMMGLRRLRNLLEMNPQVSLLETDKMVMLEVLTSCDWGSAQNRNYTVFGLSTVDGDQLLTLPNDIGSVKIPDHPAKVLMSGREKVRKEAADAIVAAVLTQSFINEMGDWGITVNGFLSSLEDLPCVVFSLSYGGETMARVSIDGWSGRVSIDGILGEAQYSKPEQIQNALRTRMERMLEHLTT